MRAAIVHNGVVINIVEYNPSSQWIPTIGNIVPLGTGVKVGPGWLYVNEIFTEPPIELPKQITPTKFMSLLDVKQKLIIQTDIDPEIVLLRTNLQTSHEDLDFVQGSELYYWLDRLAAIYPLVFTQEELTRIKSWQHSTDNTDPSTIDTKRPISDIAGLEVELASVQRKLARIGKIPNFQEALPEDLSTLNTLATLKPVIHDLCVRVNKISRFLNAFANWLRNQSLEEP